MKIRIASVLFVSLWLFNFECMATTELKAPPTDSKKNETLIEKVDRLETELEKLKIDSVDNNPYATGETLNWGTGFFAAVHLRDTTDADGEIGYMWMGKLPSWNKDGYIGKNLGYRHGVSIGIQDFEYTQLRHPDKDRFENYYSKGDAYFIKMTGGSPVLLNFISVTGYLKAMYIVPDENIYDKTEPAWGLGFGMNTEFWLSEKVCGTMGWEIAGHTTSSEDVYMPAELRVTFGLKYFFGQLGSPK